MPEPLLVRDVMRIGVPTCKETDTLDKVAALMLDQAATALVVLDEEADTRGWINEARLAAAYLRVTQTLEVSETSRVSSLTAADIMDEDVPEAPSDIPLAAAAQLMADTGADHLFFLHHAAGRTWPASVLGLRDLVRAMAGPEYIKNQGTAAPRPTPMDLFRQRYGLPKK
ncbi:MAG: CBS domain-containing protein [Chloroflexi bacterium]|nr:CBS domain-containing protein [Chloroflexota bacterium]